MKNSTKLVVATVTQFKTTVAFNQYVCKDYVNEHTYFFINGSPVAGNWVPCTRNQYDNLWLFKHDEKILDDLDVKVK